MSSSVASYTPYVPIFWAQPQWITTNLYTFEPACLAAVRRLPASADIVRKLPKYPAVWTAGRCAIGVYLTNPPHTNNSPKPTAWKTIKQYALQAVSQMGLYGAGTSVNLPSGMQIAVYEKQYIDPQNKCGTPTLFQSDRSLTLEECLRQRVIEKGLVPSDLIPHTVTNDDWDLTPQQLSEQLGEYISSLRAELSSFTTSTGPLPDSIMGVATPGSTPSSSSSPPFSPPLSIDLLPQPLPSPTLSSPTPTPAQSKAKKKKKKKSSSTEASDAFPTMPLERVDSFPTMHVGPVDFTGNPLEINVPRSKWARYGKLSVSKCAKALTQFRNLDLVQAVRGSHMTFAVPEFFVSQPCVIAVYLTHPDPEGLDTMVKDNWFNIERKARLLTLDVTKNGGAGGYIDLKSGVQIVLYDKPYMDPDATLEDVANMPLVYALDQRVYAREHGGTTLPWQPPWPWQHATGPSPTIHTGALAASPEASFASQSPGKRSVFVGLLDSWVSKTPLSYTNCLHAVRMLEDYPSLLEKPTITLSQPVIFSADNCALGIFVTDPVQAPEEPINIINTEDHKLLNYAGSLVELVVRKFGVGGFVDVVNGLQIAVWEKPWADPGNICGRISRVSLQDCLDMMVDYNSRVRKHAVELGSIEALGLRPPASLLSAAVNELEIGGSRIASSLLGPGAHRSPMTSNAPVNWAGMDLITQRAFQITEAPPMPLETGGNPFADPRGGLLGRINRPTLTPGASEFESIWTGLAGFWEHMEDGTLSMNMQGGVGLGSGPAAGLVPREKLRMDHIGGVVMRNDGDSVVPKLPGGRAVPRLGDPIMGANLKQGVIIGEGAWVNQDAFLTATGYLTSAPTGRVALVGKIAD